MEENKTDEKENPFLIPGAIIAAGFLIASAVIYSSSADKSPTEENNQESAAGVQALKELFEGGHFLGNPDAPVTMVEFSDFQCPWCEKFFQTAEPQIVENYVKTGKVKFVYRHFPFLGQESVSAALASECADEQGKFWEYHDYLFNNQGAENSGAFSADNLKKFARSLGLEEEKFNSCLDSQKYMDKIRQDYSLAQSRGVNSTPTNFIDELKLEGFLDYVGYENAIENKLNK